MTGVSTLVAELTAKRVGLLKELVPKVAAIAYLVNPDEPDADNQARDVHEAARAIARELLVLNVHSERDIEAAFTTMIQHGSGTLLVNGGGFPRTGGADEHSAARFPWRARRRGGIAGCGAGAAADDAGWVI